MRFLCLFLFPCLLNAREVYFQQEVNYNITATLDDKTHTLTGTVEMTYINHSPDTLNEIWIHLWGNAFKNRKTAFANQKLRQGSSRFYFADDDDLGYYKNLDFQTDGQKAVLKYHPEHPDIAVLHLNTPLMPGAKTLIATPFLLKIPASFSRLGHVKTSYQMTQWYPKPAVYDRKGWHPMPYLDQGEFYSEFGNFDVTLTLPQNYVVGATGTLQTPSEQQFLREKEHLSRLALSDKVNAKTDTFPASSAVLKTIRYTAEKVHDFAWFADKRFFVLKDTAQLANGRTVDCWAMFTKEEADLWEKGAFYVRRAVEFYSQHIGAYPWPHATAIHSALSAGGGMEYPMITVIANSGDAKSLDEVITHEVGHNWFYGILASHERLHAFQDEGFNSYYEDRYMRQYYTHGVLDDALPKWLFNTKRNGSIGELALLLLAREHKDLPANSPSDHFMSLDYGVQTYMKPAWHLRWLEQSAGKEQFDKAMQHYFEQWKFKHPYPEDVYQAWHEAGMDAPWFITAMNTTAKADFKLISVEKDPAVENKWLLRVENRSSVNGPLSVTALRKNEVVKTEWFPPQAAQRLIEMNAPSDADAFVLDHERVTLDVRRRNNYRRTSGVLPGVEPLSVRLLAATPDHNRTTTGILPWVGWNLYDHAQLGLLVYNPPLPSPRLQYYLAPAFATGSKTWTGLADVRAHLFNLPFTQKTTLGVNFKSFHFAHNETLNFRARYTRLTPSIRVELPEHSQTFRHALQFRTLYLWREEAVFTDDVFSGTENRRSVIHDLIYEGAQKKWVNPFYYRAGLEWQNYKDPFDRPARYLRASAEWKQDFYYKPGRSLTARFYGGYFIKNTQRQRGAVSNDLARASFALNPQGFNDYRFDQLFFARTATEGFWSRQVSTNEGGFKGAFGAPYAGVIGNSNNFIVSLNLRADLPRRLPLGLPLKPYFDIGYYDDATPLGKDRKRSEQLLWSGGLLLEFGQGLFEIYFPLANASFLKQQYCTRSNGTNSSGLFCGGNYWKWISWSLNVPLRGPQQILDGYIR